MSEEFEKIKNEVNSFRQTAENKKELERRELEERIRRDELILEKSGVRQLFEEIRDNRLVEFSPPRRYKVTVHKSFGRSSLEEKLEYRPAHIELKLRAAKDKSGYVTCLSLRFNDRSGGGETEYEEVTVAVVGEEVCLVEPRHSLSPYYWLDTHFLTPIKEGELAMTIAKALKNPIKVG